MEYSLIPTKYQLRVLSSVSSNFAVVWIAASFVTSNAFVLLVNLLLGMVAVLLAMLLEKTLEEYDS